MTPEHRRVAAFLLREEREEAQRQGIRGGAGSWAPGSGAVAGRADVQAGPGGWRIWQALRHHGSRDLVARGALVKLMILLMALIASALEFQETGRKASLGAATAVFERSCATPGVPECAAQESKPMKSFKRLVVSGCAAMPLILVTGAQAQQAVEWKVSDGGNGHWYASVSVKPIPKTIAEMGQYAAGRGASLASVGSAEENNHVLSLLQLIGDGDGYSAFIGLYRPALLEPWRWADGTTTAWRGWGGSLCASGPYPNDTGTAGELATVIYRQDCGLIWDDVPTAWLTSPPSGRTYDTKNMTLLLEWSADCNADGIVDYGQILSGELADTNGNGVPDCCEDGTACVSSLVANASFEAGSPLAACASESVSAPNMLGSAWQVSAGTVDRVRGGAACATSTQPKFGDYCVDLCGTPASSGAIRQIVATVPGHRYRCTFWLSGDASAGPATKKVRAKVGSYVDLSYTFACSGTGAQVWVPNQFEFTARGASETLEFVADNGATTGGPMLDAVNLADITTQCVGDVDGSGNVDGADIALLLLNFGDCTP